MSGMSLIKFSDVCIYPSHTYWHHLGMKCHTLLLYIHRVWKKMEPIIF